MKYFMLTVLFLLFGSHSMAQEIAADVESTVDSVACSDGTDPDAACVNLNAHPTLDQTGELLTLLLQKEGEKAQVFCDQNHKQCLSTIAPYFKKTVHNYTLRSVKLVEDDDLSVQSTVEAKIILGDQNQNNLYSFIFFYQRSPSTKLWKITQIDLKEQEPVALENEGAVYLE